MIIREKEPANLEMPFETLDGFLTPNELFYVRSHFPIPPVDLKTWRLRIEGAVEHPLSLSYEEICAMPTRTIASTLECAGNNRVFLVPKVKGTQWGLGAVGNAEWTGVPLADLLQKAGLKDSAVEVILEGADSGSVSDDPKPTGKIHFTRSIPKAKALADTLLAFQMNGETLPASHGFPLRAIVPGWYAVASIKWLQRIVVTDQPFNGYYQTVDYAYWKENPNGPELLPLTTMQVKAEIARPKINEVLPAGQTYRVIGTAWAAEAEIAQVEFSDDGGKSWQSATLQGEPVKNAWRLWECEWKTPAERGLRTLMVRATDASGQTQPDQRDLNRGTYMINHCLPIEVEIR